LAHDGVHGSNITFDLNVVDKAGKETSLTDVPCQYIYPHSVIKSGAQIADILDAQQKLISKGNDPSKLPNKYKKLNGIYEFWQTDKLKELVTDDKQRALIESYGVWAYGYFCYSAPRVLDKFNDETAGLRKGLRILRGGLQLATNSMPQGHLIQIPLTSNIGYQNQAHVVVHLSNAEPDLGRKGFQPELQEVAERLSVGIVNQLKKWRHLLLRDSGPGASHEDELKLDEWINSQKAYETEHPIELENEHFFVPINKVSITAQPLSEQDVVALFNQLIAGGVVRGIRVMASSGHKQYDGLFRYHLSAPLSNHVYNGTTNPLGVAEPKYAENFQSKPYVLEYKFDLDRLIEDFENEEKQESDIDLVVVWNVGTRWQERYQVVPLLTEDNLHHRPFHGITHELHDDNTGDKRLDLIVLSDLIFYLNDPLACACVQKDLYESED
jgi:transposase-like protein